MQDAVQGLNLSKDNWKVSEWTTATKGPREKKPHWTFSHGGAAGASVTNPKKQWKVCDNFYSHYLRTSKAVILKVMGGKSKEREKEKEDGFNAGSENAHGQASSPRSPRRVSFQEDSTGPSVNLLAELKALILAAETNGTKDLLVNLRSLVNRCVNPGPNKLSGTGNPGPRT